MKKILCVFVIILMLLAFTSCSNVPTEADLKDNHSLFIAVEQGMIKGYHYTVVYHKDTKVMYTISNYDVFTVMLDAEGKPLLWEEN